MNSELREGLKATGEPPEREAVAVDELIRKPEAAEIGDVGKLDQRQR